MKTIFVVFTVCWAFTAVAGKVWQVETWTGNVRDAGTDAGIFLYIVGTVDTEEVDSQPQQLDNRRNNFQRGQKDAFNVTTIDVGNFKRTTIFNNWENDSPGWLLSKIVVEDITAHRRYEWTPNVWLRNGGRGRVKHSRWLETPVILTKVCDPGWYFHQQSARCYKYFTDRNFIQARSHCASLGGHIAMPKTLVDNEFLYNLKSRSKDLWIGLSIKVDGSRRYVWEDGTLISRMHLDYFRANPHDAGDDTEDEKNCVQLAGTMVGPEFWTRKPTWYKTSCDKRMDYVCERNRVCDSISQSCFSYFPRKKNYREAWDHCTSLGGHLPMPKTQREHYFLWNIKPYSVYIWLGLTDLETEGTFVWDDGEPLSWSKWCVSHRCPNNDDGFGNPENCVQLQYRNYHTWNDVPCSVYYQYFCVFENSAPVPTPTDGPVNVNITEDMLATLLGSMDVVIRLDTMCKELGHKRFPDPVWETFRQEDRIRLIENDLNAITEEWRELEHLQWSGYVRIPRKNETHIEMLREAMIRYPELFPYDHERLYYDFDVPESRADYLRYNAQNALRDMEKAHARLVENVQRLREQEARRIEPNEWLSELYGIFQ